jgi:hypothetical protein
MEPNTVIPAQAGIQEEMKLKNPGPPLKPREGDGFTFGEEMTRS